LSHRRATLAIQPGKKETPIVRNAKRTGRSSAEPPRESAGRGWAALFLASRFQKALVVLEADRATPRAVDSPEVIRNRAQAG
jgi:hypothetical protein